MRQRKRLAAEGALLDAAEHELAAQGVAGCSMQAIADRASVSVGTLYNYFADKETLLQALLADRRRALEETFNVAMDAHADEPPVAQLRVLTHAMFTFFEQHRAFLQIALASDMSAAQRKRSGLVVLTKRLEAIVARGVAEGIFKKRMAHVLSAAFTGLLKAILVQGAHEKGSFVALVDDVLDLFLHGACTEGSAHE